MVLENTKYQHIMSMGDAMKNLMNQRVGRTAITILAVVAIALLLSAGTASANDTYQSTATATILAALVVTETSPLNFGDVWMGVSKAIDSATVDLGAGAGGSGLWIIAGTAADNIQASFLLPEYLWSTTVKQRIDLFFKDTDASFESSAVTNADFSTGTWVVKNPYAMGSLTFVEASVGIGLGGTVYPSATQLAAADYQGTIILTVWFEGA